MKKEERGDVSEENVEIEMKVGVEVMVNVEEEGE